MLIKFRMFLILNLSTCLMTSFWGKKSLCKERLIPQRWVKEKEEFTCVILKESAETSLKAQVLALSLSTIMCLLEAYRCHPRRRTYRIFKFFPGKARLKLLRKFKTSAIWFGLKSSNKDRHQIMTLVTCFLQINRHSKDHQTYLIQHAQSLP